jgi:SAM-dependent methyltransferase
MPEIANVEQAAAWDGPSGDAWVAREEHQNEALQPYTDALLAAAAVRAADRVIDVGCGCGETTRLCARTAVGGHAVGVDLSAAMLARARARAAEQGITNVEFVQADAQVHEFTSESFDLVVSRFGVMFFADPVKAFTNLRRAASDDAGLMLVVWRSAADNAFMTTAERAAAALLPNLPARQPDAPGQFAFADRQRVHSILDESGWGDIDIRPVDVDCTLPEKELVRYATRFGPVGRALQETDDAARARVIEAVRPAFDRYVHGDEVRFTAACWTVGARAGSDVEPNQTA